jgi:hypothetical protein
MEAEQNLTAETRRRGDAEKRSAKANPYRGSARMRARGKSLRSRGCDSCVAPLGLVSFIPPTHTYGFAFARLSVGSIISRLRRSDLVRDGRRTSLGKRFFA